jgi:hypothetical protein
VTTDKRKLAVVAALALAVLGIGAFQFTAMSKSDKPAHAASKASKAGAASHGDAAVEASNPASEDKQIVMALPSRDPFAPGQLEAVETAQPPQKSPPPDQPRPSQGRTATNFPPFPVGDLGQLPSAGGLVPTGPKVDVKPVEPPFGYSLSGVIDGVRPAAVFTDSSGSQRLVQVGGSLDGDSQVIRVENGKVTVRHRGKTMTLNVGGNPNAK